jgi:hypothetical protein
MGLVATVTIGVFFGIGFFLLAHPTEERIADSGTRDRDTEFKSLRAGVFPRPYSDAPPVPVDAELPRSVAAAALPVAPRPQGLAAHEAQSPENSAALQNSPPVATASEAPVSAATGAPSAGEAPVSAATGAPSAGEAPTSAATGALSTRKVPAVRSTARKSNLHPAAQIGPASRLAARKATLTPPVQTVPALK